MKTDPLRYRLYGLVVSSDIALPELVPATDDAPAEITFRHGAVPTDGLKQARALGPFCQVSDDALWLEVPDVARFLIRNGDQVDFEMAPGSDEDSLRVFLLGSAIGALLLQRGHLLLHGNAFEVGDGCVVCVGASGAGKSTLAAAMMARGHRIVADDVCPIDRNGFVVPGMPRLKLWQDTARRLAIDTSGLKRIRPAIAKFHLPLGEAFRDAPTPVKAIYVLSPWNEGRFEVEAIEGLRRFQALKAQSYRFRYLEGMGGAARHLQQCSALSPTIRLARIRRPRADFRIDELCDYILGDLAQHGLAA